MKKYLRLCDLCDKLVAFHLGGYRKGAVICPICLTVPTCAGCMEAVTKNLNTDAHVAVCSRCDIRVNVAARRRWGK